MPKGTARHGGSELDEAKARLREAEAALAKAIQRETTLGEEHRREIAELAHEIKTPLGAMMGYCELLQSEHLGPLGADKYREYARIVHEGALRLVELCERTLPSRSGEWQAAPLVIEDVKAVELVGEVTDLFAEMARQRGVKLVVDVAPDFPILQTDRLRLRQVLANVVSNAIKFTPSGGRVTVKSKVHTRRGAVLLVICDEGLGMSAEKVLAIMKPERKPSGTSPHGDAGAGMGLSVASRLMHELGGKLEIESKENVGSLVSLVFPYSVTKAR